jgi:hypothetical protein
MATYDEVSTSSEPDTAPFEDLLAGARKFSDIMKKAGIRVEHGFLSGFASCVMGSRRLTADIDCCVEAGWKKLREVFERESG